MSNMFLNIVSTFKGDGLAAATRQLGSFGSQATSFGSTLGKVGATLASFGLAAKAVEFTKTSIDSARDLERNMYSLNTVFGDMAPQMESFAKGAHQIGLSQKDAAKASVFLGSVLKQSGFSMEDVTEQSQKLVSLGVDLAATYGYDVQEALLGMTALFRGEYDPIEKFGVAMKQSEINSELAARGLDKLEGAARRNAEQIIRMELLYQRAADATGAFKGQSGNLFVEQQKLQAQFENMQAKIGTDLLPVIVSLTEALLPLVEYFAPKLTQAVADSIPALEGFVSLIEDMSDKNTTTGQTMNFLTEAIQKFFGFISNNFGILVQLTVLIGSVTLAVRILTGALAFLSAHPIIAGLTLLAGGILLLNEASKSAGFEAGQSANYFVGLDGAIQNSGESAMRTVGKYEMVGNSIKRVGEEVINTNRVMNQSLEAAVRITQMNNYLKFLTGRAGENVAPVAASLPVFTTSSGGSTRKQREQQAAEEAARKEKEILDKRQAAFKSFGDAVKSTFSQLKESVMSAFNLPDMGSSVDSITRNVKKLLDATRKFSSNISKLGEMGLNTNLLDQVIQSGPVAGAKLAQALVSGGSSFIGNLNADYGTFDMLANEIAGVGTRAKYGDAQTVNNYSIEVTGGVATSADVGRAVVNAIKDFERQSGAAWRG
jgi:hypothetical protein